MRKNDPIRQEYFNKIATQITTRIGQVRTQANMSAKFLSKEIGMNEGYISRLETKKEFLPSLEVLLKICEVCGITPAEFFYHNPQSYKQDMELISLLSGMSNDKKEALISLLKK